MIPWAVVENALRHAASRSVGAVYVSGSPGGLIRLRGPVVVGTWTTGTPLAAPLPSARSGAPAGTDGTGARGRVVMADAVFAIAAGRIEAVREETGPAAVVTGALDLERLLREVRRRLDVVVPRGSRRPLRPGDDRVRPAAGGGAAAVPLTARERSVLELAAGQHSLRDIAFLLDRSVFGVTLDVVHLLDSGLLEIVPDLFEPSRPAPGPVAEPAADHTAGPPVSSLLAPRRGGSAPLPVPPAGADAPQHLVQRVPGATGAGRSRWPLRRSRG